MSRSSSYEFDDDYSHEWVDEVDFLDPYPESDNATDRGSGVECSNSDDSTSWRSLSKEDGRVTYNYHRPQVADASQVKGWITECETQHCGDCAVDSRVGKGLHNLRVIDCECNTVVSAPTDCRYVALSYVWGQHRSDSETLLDPPKTVAHSIQFVRKLGYRYLWIDKYCMDQMDAKDKHTQVLQMGSIYAAAQITFVAAAGKDPTYGLPGVLSGTRTILKRERIGSVWLSPLPGRLPLENVAGSEWASRAWTFQEFYRARRRLISTNDELIYVCNSGIKHEMASPYTDLDSNSDYTDLDSNSDYTDLNPNFDYTDDYWLQQWLPPCKASGATKRDFSAIDRAAGHLKAYSQRRLTYDADALDAITGALEPLRDESVDHVWGVPFSHGYEDPSYARHECKPAPQLLISQKANKPGLTPTCILGWINWIKGTRKVQSAVPADLHHTSMALLWYHEKPCRRRSGFPSWSSLGWAGPLRWSMGYPGINMAHTCNARLHFTSVDSGTSKATSMLDLELPNWRTTVHALEKKAFMKIDFAKIWPCLELRLKTRQLDVQLNQGLQYFSCPNQRYLHLVSLGLSDDYKISFRVEWDADPTQLNTPHLKGALIHTSYQLFVMVLAPHGELFERVGLIELPLLTISIGYSKSEHGRAFLWRNNPAGLIDGEEKKKEKDFLDLYRGRWKQLWTDVFKDNGPILLG